MTPEDKHKINNAWYEAQKRRPYIVDQEVIKAITPDGGEWTVEPRHDHHALIWNGEPFATISHRLGRYTAADIAMGMRATSVMDKALRSIMVLAEDAANMPLIIKIARTAIAYVEMPAPKLDEPDDEDESAERDC